MKFLTALRLALLILTSSLSATEPTDKMWNLIHQYTKELIPPPYKFISIEKQIERENYFINEIQKSLKDEADPSSIDVKGNTPLHIAIKYNLSKLVDLLMNITKVKTYVENLDGESPIILARRSLESNKYNTTDDKDDLKFFIQKLILKVGGDRKRAKVLESSLLEETFFGEKIDIEILEK